MDERIDIPVEELIEDIRINVVDTADFNSRVIGAYNDGSAEKGLEADDHHHASRNILHPLYNFTSFNLGYHTAHHMHPGLHWTQLPEVHTQIAHRIPSGLISHRLFPHRSELRAPEPLASAD